MAFDLVNLTQGDNFRTTDLNAGSGTRGESITTNTPDPFRKLLLDLITQQVTSGGQVPDYTLGRLEEFTRNPALAAQYFPQLAEPLLAANRDAQAVQSRNVLDQFRKAGGAGAGTLQSGAFAQAGRQLAGDFARQDQEALAKAYIPLTSQLSENTTNAIKAGLALPEAQAGFYRNLVPLITGLSPLQTRTQTSGLTQNLVVPGGQTAAQQGVEAGQLTGGFGHIGGGAPGGVAGFYRI